MEILQVYTDVPAIELGTEDYSVENFPSYSPSAELAQYWRSIDPGLHSRRSFDTSQFDTSAHIANMEKRLLNLANSAYGCGRSLVDASKEDPSQFGQSTMWGSGSDAPRAMRYMSPSGSWGGSLSSTNSTSSDYAFSPDVSRHHVSLYRDDLDSQVSFGSPYPVPYSQTHYSYASPGSYAGNTMASSAARDQAIACSMKELQYTPDPEHDDTQGDSGCIKVETRPEQMAPTPESCSPATETSSRSDYDDSMKDEEDEKGVDSDIDPEYSPVKSRSARRFSSSSKHPTRSPTISRKSFMQPTTDNNRVLKSSQRSTISTKSKTKNASRRRSNNKNGDSRPFICSFSHYGCESRFSSKNEWKRHVSSQHLQLGFYRCDTDLCHPPNPFPNGGTRTYNDFNRKDLFTQHHRRMHVPWTPANKPPSKQAHDDFEESLEAVRQRCWHEKRKAPKKSQCIFCHVRFEGETAWEERMEHIGKHFEKAEREKKELGEGREDPELKLWALDQGLIVDCGDRGCWLDGLQGNRRAGKSMPSGMARRGKVVNDDVGGEEDAAGDDE